MDFGTAQQILQALTPQPTGRPRFISSAIRLSVVVALMGLRNTCRPLRLAPLAALIGALALSITLSRSLLQTSELTPDHIGRLPFILLQVVYALAFFTLSSALWRKIRVLF